MTPDEMRTRVEHSANVVALELYEGVAYGLAEATARLSGFPNLSDYPHLLPLLARAGARNHWDAQGLPHGWRLTGNPHLMGQTILAHDSENMEMRLLKERRRTYPGGVPVAGSNEARRAYWQTTFGVVVPAVPILGERLRLLLLWDHNDDRTGFILRLVHTTAAGVYGKKVPFDLSYDIRPDGGMFNNLRFPGDPQNDDFFGSTEIDRGENQAE